MGGRSGSGPSMGKGAGKAGSGDGFGNVGDIKNIESLKNIKDRQLYNEMKQAISRFYKELGLPQKEVKLADMPANWAGVHVTVDGKTGGVYLNKKYFKNGTKKSVTDQQNASYKSGLLTKTNKPVAHTMTHELAHSVWNSHMTGAKQKAAGKEISKIYTEWKKDRKKSGYGSYAGTNISEFWAETITKGIHGKSDRYTKALKNIAKKYKL